MKTTEVPIKKEHTDLPTAENKKGVEFHKKAANHFEHAAKHHLEAAKHHEDGNHEKAAQSTVIAHGHSSLGHEAQKENVKHHASKV